MTPSALSILEPHPSDGLSLLATARGVALNPAHARPPDVLALAVKPQALDAVAPEIAALAGERTLILSILAGKTIANLRARLPGARVFVRAMPNTPAAIGRGVTAAFASPEVTAEQRRWTERLLGAVGAFHWLDDEAAIDAVTAISGGGPAYARCMRAGSPAPRGLGDRRAHRARLLVGVHQHGPVDVAGGAPYRLDQRGLAAQEALLVGVEDRHERHLGKVQALPQEVHADEHVVLAEPQVADDLDPFQRVDLRVQVSVLNPISSRYCERSSLIFFVRVVTSTRSSRSTLTRTSFIRSSIWLCVWRTSTTGSTIPVGRTICSTITARVGALVFAGGRGDEHQLRA